MNGEKKASLFSVINKLTGLENWLVDGLPFKFLPQILFISILGVLYVGNSHKTDKIVRKIQTLETEVEDLRANYTTLKAQYMFASKQSEVALKVKKRGVVESKEPPYKIIVKKGEY